jgi:hypothetical protein
MRRRTKRRPRDLAFPEALAVFWKGMPGQGDAAGPAWTLLTSHGVVLFVIAANSACTTAQIARASRLTTRRVVQLIHQLQDAGLVKVKKIGRQNTYLVNRDAAFRHPTLAHVTLGQFQDLLLAESWPSNPW